MKTCISFGEVLVDRFPNYEKMGGAPANIAFNLNQLGTACSLISAVGTDETGLHIINELKQKQIDTTFVQSNSYPTGWVQVTFNGTEASYSIIEHVAWDYIQFNESFNSAIQQCDCFCFSSLAQRNTTSKSTLHHILSLLPDSCITVFDVNLRPPFFTKEVLEHSFMVADVVKLNETEYETIQDLFTTKNLTGLLTTKFKVRIVIKTLGKKGSEFNTDSQTIFFPSIPIDTSLGDSVGVGDAFISCVVHHLLKGSDPKRIMTSANRYAGLVATKKGAMVSLQPNELREVI